MASYSDLANRPVLTQPVYEAGRPIEVVAREFGLDPADVIKLASNENPLGPSRLSSEAAGSLGRILLPELQGLSVEIH